MTGRPKKRSVALTQKNAPKKRAVKSVSKKPSVKRNTATKKTSTVAVKTGGKVKKTTERKVVKNAVKKTAAKKQTTKKVASKAVTKKATIKKVAATKKKPEIAIQKTTQAKAASKQSVTKATPAESVSVETSHRISYTDEGVTIFSRVKTDNAVLLVARIVAMFFIFIGTTFALLGLNRTYDTGFFAPVLTAIDTQFGAVALTNTTRTVDSINSTTSNTAPTVKFNLPGDSVSGVMRLLFTVEQAESLTVRLYYKDESLNLPLGSATSDDGSLWKYEWDTRKFQDGEYRIIAYVKTAYGLFEAKSDTYVHVENHPFISSDTHASSTASTTPVAETLLNFNVTRDVSNPLTIRERFGFSLPEATSVRFFLVHNTDTPILVGPASQVSGTNWSIQLDPALIPAGTYTPRLVAKTTFGTIEEVTPNTSIVIGVASTTATQPENVPVATTSDSVIAPEATIDVGNSTALSGSVPVLVSIPDVRFTELYARPQNSLRDIYIGTGQQVSAGVWRLLFDTTAIPNGTYTLITKHANQYGSFVHQSDFSVTITNVFETVLTEKDATYLAELEAVQDMSIASTSPAKTTETEVEQDASEYDNTTNVAAITSEYLQSYKTAINEHVRTYTEALQLNNTREIRRAEQSIDTLTTEIIAAIIADERLIGSEESVTERVKTHFERLLADTATVDELVKSRIGDAVTTDSDNDGITDYDEITIYKTNPLSADSDNDGFTDGAEIVDGFDPNSPKQESPIVYESPQDTGVEREDILAVTGIVSETPEVNTTTTVPAAVITGTALPNSFVTLYIFSTPIIVTVRTGDDGSWSYRFDKELEDGTHEIYVGITDNTGKLVAKSSPFNFVKEAQAFTPVDAVSNGITTAESEATILGSDGLIIALSAIIISLGFILLMISYFFTRRNQSTLHSTHVEQSF